MNTINEDIFDLISRYEEGELSKAERKEVEQKLRTDKLYQEHRNYYHTITGAISEAALAVEKAQLKEWHAQDISATQADTYESAVKKERQLAKRNQRLLWVALLVLIAGLSFFLGQFTQNIEPVAPPVIQPDKPRAMGEPGEVPLAASGTSRIKQIPYWVYKVDNGAVLKEERQENIKFIKHSSIFPAYRFSENQLEIYTSDITAFESIPVEWILLDTQNKLQNYLKLDNKFYSITVSETKQELQEETNEAKLNLLK